MELNSSPKKILVVDDEEHLLAGLELNLTLAQHQVFTAQNGKVGIDKWRLHTPDLIVLDLMMPIVDGFAVLKEIRQSDERLPIMVLSAHSDTKEKIKCFSLGADDYLVKPFALSEFLLRVDRLLQRASWSKTPIPISEENNLSLFRFGKNTIDFRQRLASNGDQSIELTVQEIKLLALFVANLNLPLTREQILEQGFGYRPEISSRTIDNFIVRFRKYFEKDPKNPVYFRSLRSVGYVFSCSDQGNLSPTPTFHDN